MASTKEKRKKKLLPYVIIFISSALFSIFVYVLFPTQLLERKITDELFVQRGPISIEDSPIIMVAISEQADSEIPYKWPWPTSIHAKLIENLNKAGAKVIAFDVLFSEKDQDPRNDTLFAKAISEAGNVILAANYSVGQNQLSDNQSLIYPTPAIADGLNNPVGFVSVLNDIDGLIREYKFAERFKDETYLMLGHEALKKYQGIGNESIQNTDKSFEVGEYATVKNNPNSFIINYHGPNAYFPSVSYEEVIDDSTFRTQFEIDAEFDVNAFDDPYSGLLQQGIFKDKIVIVGATMLTLQDYHPTPFATGEDYSGQMAGYEIHANAIQSMLNGNAIKRMDSWLAVGMVFFIAALVVGVNRFFISKIGIPFSVVLIIGYVLLGYSLFINQNFFVIFTLPILTIFFAESGTVIFEYLETRREKVRIQGMFSSYVSPKLVKQMIDSGEEPKLGGEEQVVTAFFSDIASFSAFSEVLEPKRLVTLINEYLSEMTDILTSEGGTLDKYIGDAIVGIFGAPVVIEEHAFHACLAAQLMQQKQTELRQKWAKEDWPEIVSNMRTRIGLNTGEMVTGNMGSSKRFNYTMMGDNVNLAARCESGAKTYGVYTMVTDSTRIAAEKVSDRLLFRYLDNIVVMGRKQPVKVHEIVAFKKDETQQISDLIGLFQEGVDAYLDRKWDVAISKFEISAHLELFKPGEPGVKTNPSEMYIERCHSMKELPEVEPWDGVFKMRTK